MTIQTKVIAATIGSILLAWLLFGVFGIQALVLNKTVNDAIPVATVSPDAPTTTLPRSPRLIAEGGFEQGDSTYTIKGKATITEQDGVRTLSLSDFDVTNGPDLFVYIVSAPDVQNTTVKQAVGEKQFTLIAPLKGNRGNQTYVLPAEVELNDQSVVSIWCRRFSRNFGAADLEPSA